MKHSESHKSHRIGWLRAAVLGANDGIVSTASLILGVASAHAAPNVILLTGIAGLMAGAMSMAAGEYVSVSSQADTESADLVREAKELLTEPDYELKELQRIYMGRGISEDTAYKVASELTAYDALASHARDELGISEIVTAKPIQAALTSAGTFAVGAGLPLLVTILAPSQYLIASVAICSLLFLAVLGGLASQAGGASLYKGAIRVAFWGALAMLVTGLVGKLFGVAAG